MDEHRVCLAERDTEGLRIQTMDYRYGFYDTGSFAAGELMDALALPASWGWGSQDDPVKPRQEKARITAHILYFSHLILLPPFVSHCPLLAFGRTAGKIRFFQRAGFDLKVLGQEERLRQVFINLIYKAVKYGEEGTEIRTAGKIRFFQRAGFPPRSCPYAPA